MDEKTVRVVLQIPDDMLEFLGRLAYRQGFNTRAIAKAIRFCIREEAKREAKTSSPSRDKDLQALL